MRLFSSISTVFTIPATPLAPSRCPIFDLIDPMDSGCSDDLRCAMTLDREAASMGSPAGVPVP